MNLQDEIAKVAYDLYEKSGRINGRDMENWIEAERIVKASHPSDDLATKVKRIEEKTEGLMIATKEVVKVTLQELNALSKKVFKKNIFN